MFVIDYHKHEVDSVAFAPAGGLLAVGHRHQWIGVWDLATRIRADGAVRDSFYTRSEFRFVPGQARYHILRQFGELEWRDPVAQKHGVLCNDTGWAENAVLTPDGKRLLVYERGYCEFRLFDLARSRKGKRLWAVPVYGTNAWGAKLSIELHPDGERFVVAEDHSSSRTRVTVRSLANGDLLGTGHVPNTSVGRLALAPDGSQAVVISGTSLFVFNPDRVADAPRRVANDNRRFFTGLAFHPLGRYLAATSNDATVKLYDTNTWDVARTFTWDIGKMRAVAFSADGALAAAGSDTGKVVVWDVDT